MTDPPLNNDDAARGEQIPEHHRVVIAAAVAAYAQSLGLQSSGFSWGVLEERPATKGNTNGRVTSLNGRLGNHDPRGSSHLGKRSNRQPPR